MGKRIKVYTPALLPYTLQKMGSRKAYTPEEIKAAKAKILKGLSKGQSLMRIKRKNKDLPCRDSIYKWFNVNSKHYDPEFADDYARAKQDSADVDAEKIEGLVRKVAKKELSPGQARVMIDALKWAATHKQPKKYGAKLDVTSANEKLESQVVQFQIPDNGRGKEGN